MGQNDLESVSLQPVDLGMPMLKELGAKWLVETFEYIEDNPKIIVNGFCRSGITDALDDKDMDEADEEDEADEVVDVMYTDEEDDDEDNDEGIE